MNMYSLTGLNTQPDAMMIGAAWSTTVKPSTARWAIERFPLKIYLAPALGNTYTLFSAIQQWQQAGVLPLQCAVSPQNADIVVQYRAQAEPRTVLGRDFEVGHTDNTVDADGWIEHSQIELVPYPVIDEHLDEFGRQNRLTATLLHEIGHSLGLEHSTNPRDVMFYRGWQNTVLSASDLARLRQLYS